jgi:hypothetical protein
MSGQRDPKWIRHRAPQPCLSCGTKTRRRSRGYLFCTRCDEHHTESTRAMVNEMAKKREAKR